MARLAKASNLRLLAVGFRVAKALEYSLKLSYFWSFKGLWVSVIGQVDCSKA